MGKFVRNVIVEVEFEGETARVTLKPMSYSQALKAQRLVPKKDEPEPEDMEEKYLDVFADSLRVSVIDFSGITAADNTPVKIEDVLDSAYFLPLLVEIGQKWMEATFIGGK